MERGSRPAFSARLSSVLLASTALSGEMWMGTHPSAYSTIRLNTWGTWLPSRMGGCGFCLGFG